MLWLASEKPKTVSAVGNRICTASTAFKYQDFVAATFQFPSGLVGRVTANFGCVHRHQHVVRLFGTQGTFLYDDQGPRAHFSRDPQVAPQKVPLATLPATKGDLIKDFVDHILEGRDLHQEMQHEFNLISVCVAADLALATSKTTEIEYV